MLEESLALALKINKIVKEYDTIEPQKRENTINLKAWEDYLKSYYAGLNKVRYDKNNRDSFEKPELLIDSISRNGKVSVVFNHKLNIPPFL